MLARFRGWRLLLLFLCGLCWAIAISLPRLPASAQQVTQARVVEILDSDRVFIQNRKARINSIAQRGQQVRTGQARVGLRLDNNAGIRLGQNSSLIVGRRCVQLRRGRVLIGGRVRGCIGSVAAVTRGTLYLMEQDEYNLGKVSVLEGAVVLSDLYDPTGERIILRERQSATIVPPGSISEIEEMSLSELEDLVRASNGLFQDFQVVIPSLGDFYALLQRLGLAPSSTPKPVPGLW